MIRKLGFIGLVLMSLGSFSQTQKNVTLIDNWTDLSIEKGQEDIVFNEVWGFSQNGENYGVIGSSIGAHLLKVEKNSLDFIGFEPGRFQSKLVEHRDYATYKNYLYAVCDEGTSSLQIFDLSNLPNGLEKVYDDDTFFQICHNIFIDTNRAKLYACGANNMGMLVFDISSPENPLLEYTFNELDYVHDCFVRNDTAFLNAALEGLFIYDFEPEIPVQLGIIDFYPNQGYNHSGWLAPSSKKYVFADENQGTKLKLCTWEDDLSKISIIETFGTRDFEDFIPHNMIVLDQLAFVSYYNEGLRIFDLSDFPIREIGVYDTFPGNGNFKFNGAWGVYVFENSNQILISDRQSGLFLFSFPIQVLNNPKEGTFVTSVPFLDEEGILIPRDHLREDNLFFAIHGIDGSSIYTQQNFLSYLNIPLEITTGIYIFSIYDEFGNFLESGKFVKAN